MVPTFLRTLCRVVLACIALAACDADGGTIAPKVRLEFSISEQDVAELRDLLTRFARAEGFVLKDSGPKLSSLPLGRQYFWLTLTRGETMEIVVNDFLKPYRFHVYVYDLDFDPRFDQTASMLEAKLREKWPGRVAHMTGR